MRREWTDEMIAMLRKLLTAGFSCSMIAAELGDGVTRNAVIGKISRLGLSGSGGAKGHNATVRKRRTPAIRRPVKPKAAPKVVIDVMQFSAPLNGEGVPLLDRKQFQCAWIVTDDARVCGHPISNEHFSWCSYHCSIGLVKPVKPNRENSFDRHRTNEAALAHAFR